MSSPEQLASGQRRPAPWWLRLRRRGEGSLATRFNLVLALVLVPLLGLGLGIQTRAATRVRQSIEASLLAERAQQLAERTFRLVLVQDDATKGLLLDANRLVEEGTRKVAAFDWAQAATDSLLAVSSNAELRGIGAELRLLADSTLQPLDTRILETVGGGNAVGARRLYFSEYLPARERYSARVGRLIVVAESLGGVARAEADRAQVRGAIGSGVVLTSILFATALAVVLICRRLAVRLAQVSAAVEAVAAGRLDTELVVTPHDEVGRMGEALNRALAGMRQALGLERVNWDDIARLRETKAEQDRLLLQAAARERELAEARRRVAEEEIGRQAEQQRMERAHGEERRAAEAAQVRREQEALSQREVEQRERAETERARAAELRAKVDAILAVVTAAQSGDLTREVPVRGEDAIGRVGEGLAEFLGTLRSSMIDFSRNAEMVAAASTQVNHVGLRLGEVASETSAQAQVVSASAEEVSQNVHTVAAGTEEMTASIREIAKNAADAARVAMQAVNVVERTNGTVERLGASSVEIGEIVKVITAIAQQTNLLALNATIEAARAGEAGKGFAVVANEVKELAKETARATEEIGRKVEAIQTSSTEAVSAIREVGTIIAAINRIQTTIATAVEEQTATTNEMARNVAEAARGAADIATNIEDVARTAQGTSDGATQSQQAAQDLDRAAESLQALVGRFRVGAGQAETRRAPEVRMAVSAQGPKAMLADQPLNCRR